MAIAFDAPNRRIILDSSSVTAVELWSRWADWVALDDNAKWLPALKTVGGDDLGGGLSIPPYVFLLNGWRVRPMEANHQLIVTGNLFVDGGGAPVVNTLGAFNVSVQLTVPMQAQGINTGAGSSSGATPEQVALAVRSALAAELARLDVSVSSRHASGAQIQADVRWVNGTAVAGDGSDGNPWGPA